MASGDDPPDTLTDLHAVQREARHDAEATDQRAELSSRAVKEMIRRQTGKFALAGMLFAIAASLVAVLIAANTAADVSTQAAQNAQTRAAVTSLDDANRALAARGQPPIATPTSGDPAEITGAAIKARVIAALPPSPSADQVAGLLAPALAGNVLAPSPQDASKQLADYYARTRPPPAPAGAAGATGAAGQPGRAPTQGEIEAAVLAQSEALRGPQGGPGSQGLPGERGEKGDRGDPGEAGPGGPPGPGGPAGPACPDGTSLAPVQFAGGQEGQGCVTDAGPAPTDGATPTSTD